jgi:hypothetical protein
MKIQRRVRHRVTDLVDPFPSDEPAVEPEEEDHLELDWCFRDEVLALELRHVRSGRGPILAVIAGSIALIAIGIASVL